jgi:hypothetical protein
MRVHPSYQTSISVGSKVSGKAAAVGCPPTSLLRIKICGSHIVVVQVPLEHDVSEDTTATMIREPWFVPHPYGSWHVVSSLCYHLLRPIISLAS